MKIINIHPSKHKNHAATRRYFNFQQIKGKIEPKTLITPPETFMKLGNISNIPIIICKSTHVQKQNI